MALISSPRNLHPQSQSPFFTVLPPEIRNEIYSWALLQYEDSLQVYKEDSFWSRPGFRAPLKSRSHLLRVCRLAYIEAKTFLTRNAEHAFWFDRGPPERSEISKCQEFFEKLSAQNVEDLVAVRFFTQMYWLEEGENLQEIFAWSNFRPEKLTITIRYSDWWWWESNEDLRMQDTWLQDFCGPPSLRKLTVEYETLTWKKTQMERIILRNKKFKLRLQDEGNERGSEDSVNNPDLRGYLSAEDTKLVEWKWTGPSKLDGKAWHHHGSGETVEYVVIVDHWQFVQGDLPVDE